MLVLIRWIFVLVWMGVIFAFSHQAHSSQATEVYFGGFNIFVRKMGHISEFAILYFLVRWALLASSLKQAETEKDSSKTKRWQNVIEDKTILGATLISIAYAISDEWHQSFVPGRSACVEDVMLDSSAVLVAVLVTGLIDKIFAKLRGAKT
ncbi:MAG: VanZ family protein [Candidatus Melainabacteria bacterium]|nr:VanZ family protein [Candidatus Melainabacteria bacterium]